MTWIALAAAAVALAAAAVAYRSARAAQQALSAMRVRGFPAARSLEVTVIDGRAGRNVGHDVGTLGFLVSISNRSDEAREISQALLRVNYRTRENLWGATDVPFSDLSDDLGGRTGEVGALRLPLLLEPGGTTIGWLHFPAPNALPRHGRIDAHTLVVTDDKGRRHSADATMPGTLEAGTVEGK